LSPEIDASQRGPEPWNTEAEESTTLGAVTKLRLSLLASQFWFSADMPQYAQNGNSRTVVFVHPLLKANVGNTCSIFISICSLLYDTVSISNYTASNEKDYLINNEQQSMKKNPVPQPSRFNYSNNAHVDKMQEDRFLTLTFNTALTCDMWQHFVSHYNER
jgi:hypothetical protein